MKLNKNIMALATAAAFGFSGQAFAAGTLAGTSIQNTATLNFSVNSVVQTEQTDDATFLVDNKVNLTLISQESFTQSIVPNGPNTGITYSVEYLLTNTGNQTQDYKVSVADLVSSSTIAVEDSSANNPTTDTIDLGAILKVYVDNNDDGLTIATDTQAYVNDLAPDASRSIFVVIDENNKVPDTLIDKAVAGISLTAETQDSSINDNDGAALTASPASEAFNPTLEQVVFADAGLNGLESANAAFEVSTANLSISKSVEVINDPFTGALDTSDANPANHVLPKAIPGATLRYTIIVENTGSQAASAVNVVEDLTLNNAANTNLGELDRATISNIVATDATSVTSQADFITNGILTVVYSSLPGGTVAVPTTRTITFDIDIK